MKKNIFVFLTSLFCITNLHGETSFEIKGSSTIYPLCRALSAKYYQVKKRIVTCDGGGSGFGVKFALSGGVGAVSRSLTEEEKGKGLSEYPVALDGLAFLVNKSNPLKAITTAQLKEIYMGKTVNWSGLDKSINSPIKVLGPNSDHGTFDSLVTYLELKEKTTLPSGESKEVNKISKDFIGFPSHNETIYRVENDNNAIGAVPLGFWNKYKTKKVMKLSSLLIDKIIPTTEAVRSFKYPSTRKLNFVWSGKINQQTQDFFDFVKTKEAQKIIEELGYVTF